MLHCANSSVLCKPVSIVPTKFLPLSPAQGGYNLHASRALVAVAVAVVGVVQSGLDVPVEPFLC